MCPNLTASRFYRTCNVLPFSCTYLALWREGKRPKVHAKQKGFKNFFILGGIIFSYSTYTKDYKTFSIPNIHHVSVQNDKFIRTGIKLHFQLFMVVCMFNRDGGSGCPPSDFGRIKGALLLAHSDFQTLRHPCKSPPFAYHSSVFIEVMICAKAFEIAT